MKIESTVWPVGQSNKFSIDQEVYSLFENKIWKGKIIGLNYKNIIVGTTTTTYSGVQILISTSEKSILVEENCVFEDLNSLLLKLSSSTDVYSELYKNVSLHTNTEPQEVNTFDEYQKVAMSTKNYGKGLPIFYPALKLNGEAGEVAEKVGKAWRDKEGIFDEEYKNEIKKEMGDTLWYICALADDLQINLSQVANTNIVKILDRKKRGVTSGNGDNR